MDLQRQTIKVFSTAFAVTFFVTIACAIVMAANAEGLKVKLSGDQEVLPVSTQASASGTITVSPDMSVSGSITVSGMEPTAAHIHEGAVGRTVPLLYR